MNFEKDLELWEKFELFVCKIMKAKYWMEFTKNTDILWVDLIWETTKAEIKYDRKFRTTWNFFIEYMCSWKRSWILKYNCDYFCYWDENNFWVFDRYELWQLSIVWGKKVVGWDNKNSKWLLVKLKDIDWLELFNFNRKDYG